MNYRYWEKRTFEQCVQGVIVEAALLNLLRTVLENKVPEQIRCLSVGFSILLLMGCSASGSDTTNKVADPKVIMIIGDGMDDQQISIARNYLAGGGGNLAMDAMQYRGAIKPQTVLEDDPAVHVHVTGSASATTAMASGIVSSGSRIGTHPQTGMDAVTIMELADGAGIATGVVTTASVTDATPASFMAHTGHRRCQGPENMVQTDRQNERASFDCGSEHKSRGGNGATPGQAEPFACEDNPAFGGLPRLPEMVATAISRLERKGSFILVVEDEAIDEHTHGRQPCGHIGGVAQIDETVRLVLKYAESHPELLVIVTADHGHAAQIIAASIASGQGRTTSPGSTALLVTVDGSVLGINYTTTTGPNSQAVHSGVQVPLLAGGPGVSEWPIFLPQTELFHIMRKHLGLDDALSADD